MRTIPKPKIYNYARVSTTKQLKGVGLETQQQRSVLERLSQEHNLPIHDEDFVDEGLSAYHGNHKDGEFGAIISRVESGEIAHGSILVVFSLDRISREATNVAMAQLLDFINKGVRVYTHIDDKMYDSSSKHLFIDLMYSFVTMERANEESRSKSVRIISGKKIALERWYATGEPQGALGRSPFWIDQPTNSFNINADGVKKAIEMKIDGYGDRRIKKFLDANYQYKPTRRGKIHDKKNSWGIDSIYQLSHKHLRALIGDKTCTVDGKKHVLENYYPPLIDENTYRQLKLHSRVKEGRNTSTGRIPLLKGISQCGICGAAMSTGERSEKLKRYYCNQSGKGEHGGQIFNADVLEILTLYVCRDEYLIESISGDDNDLEQKRLKLETELFEQRASLESLCERYKKKPNSTYFDLIEDCEDKIAVLEEDLAALYTDSVEFTEDELSGLSEIFSDELIADHRNPKRLEIKKLLRRFISSIVFNRNRLPCDHNKTGWAECIDITWNFKNGQKRRLAMLPFEYFSSHTGSKELYLPFVYTYGCNTPMDANRDRRLIYAATERLHAHNLTSYLYPSRGRYQWEGLSLIQGVPFWAPLDSTWFPSGNTSFFTDKTTSSNISLLLNYLPNTGKIYELPDRLFDDLSSIFEFTESPDLHDILNEHIFGQGPEMVFELETSEGLEQDCSESFEQQLSVAIDDGLLLS